jgi:RHS repeat-associated protein
MKQYNNSAGKEVTLTYKSSTHYYLEDKKAGKPWITKLPFPVHGVEKTETKDLVSDTVYSNLYTYHHGYYDHAEREFRGFGRVETLDTETFVNPNPADDPEDVILDEPPILTKTWYHTGAWIRQDKILNHYKKEYYVPDGAFAEHDLVQPSLPAGWTAIECREALRALKGVPLRQEVYAQDGTEQQSLPYTAIEYNYDIRQIQAKDENRFAVYLVHEKENIAYNYERNPDDPRVAHSLNIEIDEYANIKQAATVVYGRKDPPLTPTVVHDEQIKIHVIYTLNEYTNDINVAEAYRLRLPYYVRQFELTGSFPEPDPDADYFTTEKLLADFIAATEIDYSVIANNTDLEKRLVEAQKIIFLADDAVTPLSETDIESKAIPYQTYRLAFTEDLIADVYDTKVDVSDMVIDEGKYIEEVYILDGASKNYYWIPSGTVTYDEYSYDTPGTPAPITPADHFFLPYRYTDPFWGTGGYTGNKTHLKYYGDYHLLLEGTKDELGDVTLVKEWEWRILQPSLMMDINDNHTNMVYDILGMPVGMALMGKGSPGGLPTEADSLDGFEADLSNTVRDDFFEDPIDDASGLLLEATARFIYDYDHVPLKVATIIREVHNASDPDSPLQLAFEYSDGLGRLLMKKVQAEPGGFFYIEDDVLHEYRPDDAITYPPPTGWDGHRWVGTGRTILNNKGKPIKQYEPYFSSTHLYEYDSQLVQVGFSPVIRYDAVGRAIRTDMPDGTYNKVEFDAWMQRTYDANDNVNDSLWKADRETGGIYYGIAEEMDALAKTVIHANTPLTVHTDSLARSIYTIQHNKVWTGLIWDDEFIESFVVLDIESNTKQVIDGRVNTQFIYAHDMLGNIIYQKSIDSGERWMLNDLFGKPIYGWDSMGQKAHNVFDKLHRPTEGYIDDGVTDRKISEIIYGTASADNNIGQIYQSYDGSGKTEVVKYDFKGNLLQSILQLLSLETIIDVDWGTSPTLATETFTTTMKYDALNRPYYMKDAGNNVTVNEYNEAGLLTKVSMKPDGASLYTDYVADIDYNAKGQREAIWYGNGTKTKYTYHLKSFRLTRLLTTKSSSIFQDLNYYYDPVGNITTLRDDNYDTINNEQLMFFNNDVVSPTQAFTYDALYRLTEASGRELKGENSFGTNDNYNDSYWLTSHKGNGNNVQNYTQKYKYDKVGNIMQLKHIASAKSYTRDYTYYSDSNKLKMTEIGTASYRIYNSTTGDPYYDAHGNITKMPHLVSMVWNALDQLSYVSVGTSTTNYYQYGGGQRVRKTTNKSGGIKEQRIYLGSYEIYRKFTSGSLTVERKTVHIADDTGRIALYEKRTVGTGTSDGGTTAELIRYIYSNHLQSSSLELDNTAAIISYEEYHPFGTTSYQAMNASIKAVAKRYRYTGKERDEESGFYFHGARYYIPWLCRWSAVDPLESKFAGMSSYNYSFNNPVMWNDPDGKDPNDDKKKQSKSVKGKGSGSVGLKSTSAKPTTPKKDLATHPDAPKFKNAGDKEKKYDVRKADPETPYQKNLRDRKRIEENMQIIAANRAKAAALDPYAYNLGNSPGVQAGLTVVLPGVAIVQGATQAYEGFQTNNNVQFGLGVATVALGTYSAAKSMNGNFNAAPEQKFIPKIENTNGPGVGTKFTLSMEEAAKMNPEYSTRTTGNAYRYMVEGELIATRETGLLRGGRPGESYFTLDLYKSAIKVQQRLALPTAPTLRVEFEILSNPVMLRNGLKVYPAYGMPGKGAEFMTTDPVKINVINWQKLGH